MLLRSTTETDCYQPCVSHSTAAVCAYGKVSEEVEVTSGVRQGYVLRHLRCSTCTLMQSFTWH